MAATGERSTRGRDSTETDVLNAGRRLAMAFMALSGSLLCLSALGQAKAGGYPDKPVRMIVPAPAGSGPDGIGRVLAKRLQDMWGQPVVVENIVGAGGLIGHDRGAKAPGDGYTMLVGLIGPMSVSASMI